MNTYRKTAVAIGALFIIGTVSGILSGVVTAPMRADGTYPLGIAANGTQFVAGTLLVLLMGLSLAMIPVLLYPIFGEHNKALAVGAILFRGALEGVCYLALVVSMLLLLTVSQLNAKAAVTGLPGLVAIGAVLIAAGDWISLILGLVFSIGGMMIYVLFYQTRLVPRWLSGWGLISAPLYFAAHLEGLFGVQQIVSFDSGLGFLMAPLALQEMVFAAWLIAKGFNQEPSRVAHKLAM